jgi:glucokinase
VARFALVADLGGTKIAAARVADTGRVTHRLVAATPPVGGVSVIDALAKLMRQLPAKGACAIGVDVPGVAHRDGTVWAPNLPGWKRMPLAELLAARMDLPVVVDSDRNAFVTGEAWLGSAHGCDDVVFVMIGTGIGAGIISGGRLVRGFGELSGCAGWLAVRDRFQRGYSNVGCLEFHVAGPGIATAAQRVFHRPLMAQEVAKLARAGDKKAKQVLDAAGHFLGLGLANLVDILNPRMIVIGGGVAAAGDLLLASARRTMRQWAQPLAVKQVRVARSRLGPRAGILGMARLCFDHSRDGD